MGKKNRVGIGIDIGSRQIKLAVLKAVGQSIKLERVAAKDIPHDAIVGGVVVDSRIVSNSIAEILKENKLKGKEAAVSIGGRDVMIKKITTDNMTDEELDSAIHYEAENNLPFDLNEVCLDFAKLPSESEDGSMDVLLVAAKNDGVFHGVEPVRWAGGRVSLLEAEPFALQAALGEAGYLDEEASVVALQIGFQSTDATVFYRGQFDSNRNLNVGGKAYVEGLIRTLGIPFDRALSLLSATQLNEEENLALEGIAIHLSESLADQIERSFPEYFGPIANKPIVRIVLCGGGANLPGIEAALRRKFGVEVEAANPFRTFDIGPGTDDNSSAGNSPQYAAAVGLALRSMGGDYQGFNLIWESDKERKRRVHYAGSGTVLMALGLSAILFGVVMIHIGQENKLHSLQQRLNKLKSETDFYRDKIAVVEELTKKRADVASRIDVISELDRNRFARVKVMEIVSASLPSLTWITKLQENPGSGGQSMNVSGVTSSNLKVSQFMTSLLDSPMIRGVDLLVSQQAEIGGVDVTQFTLQLLIPDLRISSPAERKPEDQLAKGAQAIKEKRAALDKLKQESSQ